MGRRGLQILRRGQGTTTISALELGQRDSAFDELSVIRGVVPEAFWMCVTLWQSWRAMSKI